MIASFYNNNEFRDYPFLDATTGRNTTDLSSIPQELIVDARIVYFDNTITSFPKGYLVRIEKLTEYTYRFFFKVNDRTCSVIITLDEHTVTTTTTSDVVTAIPLILNGVSYGFYKDGTLIPQYTTLTTVIGNMTNINGFIDSPYYSLNDSVDSSYQEYKGYCDGMEMLVVLGRTWWLEEKPVGFIMDGEVELEPTRVIWLKNRNVTTVSVGNANRTRATYPAGCEVDGDNSLDYGDMDAKRPYWTQPADSSDPADTIITDEPIVFKEGYNCQISLNAATGILNITPILGAGQGVVNSDLSLGHYIDNGVFYTEVVPAGRNRYDGAVELKDTVRMLQNATGPDVLVNTDGGVIVLAPAWASNQLNITTTSVIQAGCGVDKLMYWGSSEAEEILDDVQLKALGHVMKVKTRKMTFVNSTIDDVTPEYLWVGYNARLGEAAGGNIRINKQDRTDYVKSYLAVYDSETGQIINYVLYRTEEKFIVPEGVIQEIM